MCSALEGQEMVMNPLELELQVLVSDRMGAGNSLLISKSRECS